MVFALITIVAKSILRGVLCPTVLITRARRSVDKIVQCSNELLLINDEDEHSSNNAFIDLSVTNGICRYGRIL